MARARSVPVPPHPDLVRVPSSHFGWLDAALLHEGWLGRVGLEAVAVLVLLVIAADRRGTSFFSRAKMAETLRLDRAQIDKALEALLESRLVAFRAWNDRSRDGVWQLLPTPRPTAHPRANDVLDVKALLSQLGLPPKSS